MHSNYSKSDVVAPSKARSVAAVAVWITPNSTYHAAVNEISGYVLLCECSMFFFLKCF